MQAENTQPLNILRFPAVVNKTGLSKSAIYGRIRTREFPAPVHLGARAVGFVAQEVDEWLMSLIQQSRATTTEEVH